MRKLVPLALLLVLASGMALAYHVPSYDERIHLREARDVPSYVRPTHGVVLYEPPSYPMVRHRTFHPAALFAQPRPILYPTTGPYWYP